MAHYKGSRQKYERGDIMDAIQSYNSYDPRDKKPTSSSTATQISGMTKIMAGLAEIGMSGITPEQLPKVITFRQDGACVSDYGGRKGLFPR